MSHTRISTALALGACLSISPALAQSTRTQQIDLDKAAKAAEIRTPVRETGDTIVSSLERLFGPESPTWRVTLGDFRPGAGLGAGVTHSTLVGERSVWTTATAWSTNNFKQASSRLELPLTGRAHLSAFLKWDDDPSLAFFGLGNAASLNDEVTYGLRTTEVGGEVQARTTRWFTYGAGLGHLDVHSAEGEGSSPPIDTVFSRADVPGLGSAPAWWHTSAFAAVDRRDSPGYADHGALYRIAFHDYADLSGSFSFDRTEIDLRRFIPLVHDNWIIALQGRADITNARRGQAVPYFMMPSIGGRDTLPGFEDYRFTDKDRLLLRSELRWTASPVVEMAVFMDHGVVAPRLADVDLRDLEHEWGIGARLHGPAFTALRVEVAHSVEGWRYNIARGISF